MARPSGEAYRNIRLCVDQYLSGAACGQFYFPRLDQSARPFRSLGEFLVNAEQELDEVGFPQSYTAKRKFDREASHIVNESVTLSGTGKLGTFDIRLLFRQHASWQGTVTWVESGDQQSFRSVLELLLLLDSALGDQN